MPKEDQYDAIKNDIVKITQDLKYHFNKGDFIDPDKEFNDLLAKIIVKQI